MKTYSLLLALMLLGAAMAAAQLPAATGHNLLLDVENKGAGGKAAGTLNAPANTGGGNNYGTTNFKENQSQGHETALGITIRSQDKTPTEVQVEWYFFAKKIKNNHASKDYVFDSGSKTITMQPIGSESFDVASKQVKTSTTKKYQTTTGNDSNGNSTSSTVPVGPDMRNGTKITGWVVRILVDGKIYDAKGSEFKFEDAAKDPDKFAELKAGKEPE